MLVKTAVLQNHSANCSTDARRSISLGIGGCLSGRLTEPFTNYNGPDNDHPILCRLRFARFVNRPRTGAWSTADAVADAGDLFRIRSLQSRRAWWTGSWDVNDRGCSTATGSTNSFRTTHSL